jgi:hypothetical protein
MPFHRAQPPPTCPRNGFARNKSITGGEPCKSQVHKLVNSCWYLHILLGSTSGLVAGLVVADRCRSGGAFPPRGGGGRRENYRRWGGSRRRERRQIAGAVTQPGDKTLDFGRQQRLPRKDNLRRKRRSFCRIATAGYWHAGNHVAGDENFGRGRHLGNSGGDSGQWCGLTEPQCSCCWRTTTAAAAVIIILGD